MKRGTSSGVVLVCFAGLATACGLFPSLDDLGGCGARGCGGASSTTSTGASGGASSACPSVGTHGPRMVHLLAAGTVSICIDATEVTVADYFEFMDAIKQATSLPLTAECAFKGTLAECNSESGVTCTSLSCCVTPLTYINKYYLNDPTGSQQRDHPVLGIDNCDAEAYCAWAGKRLCGSGIQQTQGQPVAFADLTSSEWELACRGPQNLAYGFSGDPSASCDIAHPTQLLPYNGTDAVGSNPSCAAVWPEGSVFDLVGNAFEVENNCDQSGDIRAHDQCYRRSSSFFWKTTDSICDSANAPSFFRNTKDDYSSIRCCADPI